MCKGVSTEMMERGEQMCGLACNRITHLSLRPSSAIVGTYGQEELGVHEACLPFLSMNVATLAIGCPQSTIQIASLNNVI